MTGMVTAKVVIPFEITVIFTLIPKPVSRNPMNQTSLNQDRKIKSTSIP
jgi:hypothetical protein